MSDKISLADLRVSQAKLDLMKTDIEFGARLVLEFTRKNLSSIVWNAKVGVVSRFVFFDGKCEWQLVHFGGRNGAEVSLIAHIPSTDDSIPIGENQSRFDYPMMGASKQVGNKHCALRHIEAIHHSFDEFLTHFALVHPEFRVILEPFMGRVSLE